MELADHYLLKQLSALFTALAEVLGSKVCLSRDKYNIMCCLESEQIKQCITTDWKAAQVHVLPMMQLTFGVCEVVCLTAFINTLLIHNYVYLPMYSK